MAIIYPLAIPTSIGIANIQIRAENITAANTSIFTLQDQVFSYPGQRWFATVSIPPVRRDLAEPWNTFLMSLRGKTGTFLMGDPNAKVNQGDASSCVVTGSAGETSVEVVMTGTLRAGDYIQLGSGNDTRLHKVLQDLTGDGVLDIWPDLRADYSSEAATLSGCKGVFRLANNNTSFSIDNQSFYGIEFEAYEPL